MKMWNVHVPHKRNSGEMSELVEGARLEIVCTAKSGTEGSNPSLSAMKIQPVRLPEKSH